MIERAKMKKIYLGTNTKMYMTIERTKEYLTELADLTKDIDRSTLELFVIPSFTALDSAGKVASKSEILLGAQNMCWEDEGQFTGEISPIMLKEVGVKIVEIGHSERRSVMSETDEMENKKVLCALRHKLIPLLCIGETKAEKLLGNTEEVLRSQLRKGLKDVPRSMASMVRIAYEPTWSIGTTGQPASVEYVKCMSEVVRDELCTKFGKDAANEVAVLYGGSVNNENAVDLAGLPQLNGLFIGRSAWNANNFNKIIRDVVSRQAR